MTDHLVTCFGQKPERYVLYLVWVAWFPSLGLGKKRRENLPVQGPDRWLQFPDKLFI